MTAIEPVTTPPPDEPIEVELRPPSAAIAGLPCPLVVILHNPRAAPSRRVPIIEELGPPTHLDVIWRDDDGEVLASARALPAGVREWRPPSLALGSGASLRLLVDLSELLGELPARVGELELALCDAPARGCCRLTVVAPVAAEQAVIARRPAGRSWRAALVTGELEIAEPEELSYVARELLAPYLAAARVVAAETLAEVEGQPFAELPPTLAPEAAAFEYELALARADPRGGALRETIVGRWPEIEWRLSAADDGRGALKLLRELYGARARRQTNGLL